MLVITKMEDHIKTVASNSMGARTSHEYYIRHFYRMLCADKFTEESKVENDIVFWLKRIMKGRNLQMRARLLMIIYGPLISMTPQPVNIPYIGYWDLTDTFFIENGLDELGYAMYLLYASAEAPEQKSCTSNKFSYSFLYEF